MDILKPVFNDPSYFLIASVSVVSALGVMLEKNIVRAGFSLVVCFCAVAGTYFILQAPFVGASQILIYAVGITLIIVFALMLTSQTQSLAPISGEIGKNILSSIVSIGIFIVLSYSLTGGRWIVSGQATCPKNTEVIGLKLLSTYALPFEVISILLLVALIGAVVIAKKDIAKRYK